MKMDVVKCSECAFWEQNSTEEGNVCAILGWKPSENDYCSMGVKDLGELDECESCKF